MAALHLAAPGGAHGLSILAWHRVLAAPDSLLPSLPDHRAFELQLACLRACCNVLALDEALARLQAGALPPRAACVTFDDGYADNADIALPLLRKHRLPATFFIASGFLDGGIMWNDVVIESIRQARADRLDARQWELGELPLATLAQRRGAIDRLLGRLKYLPLAERDEAVAGLAQRLGAQLPAGLMLSSVDVRKLHEAGMEIGAHTADHPILAGMEADDALRQMAWGRVQLEALAGPVRYFAYPNGKPGTDYEREHVAMVRALGFEAAVTTTPGRSKGDLFQLPRFTPWDRTPAAFALRLARNLMQRQRAV
ncbi:MAG: polysaccharide deacetylase family protein [Telluria sp.]